ncbi:FkbM family methyltransferase [Thalassobacterium maritimum]
MTRNLLGKPMQGTFKRNTFNWQLDLREVIDFMIYISGGFESYLSRFIRLNVREGDVVMDIGANIGAHTLTMGQSVGSKGRAYAVEATDYAYQKLNTNVSLNPKIAPQITAIHCVLQANTADASDLPDIGNAIHSSWPFQSTDERHPSHHGVLKSLGIADRSTLDQLVEREQITQLDLVKIDVDGHEWDVLSGGASTFQQLRPVILMELATDYNESEHARGFKSIHRFLTDLNYTFYDFKGKALPTKPQALAATIPPGSSRNVVALPNASRSIQYL